MSPAVPLNRIIKEGLSLIASEQQADGSFLSLSSPNPLDFSQATAYHTTFFSSLLLASLATLPSQPTGKQIRHKASQFLLSQLSPLGSLNYWARESAENTAMPYPDDLDDTFCGLAALYLHDPRLLDGKMMASVARLLIATEVRPGGPYRTWLVNKEAAPVWRDVDMAVNANIAFFLSLQEVSLPGLTGLLEEAIESSRFESPYYPDCYPILYFITRSYQGPHKDKLVDFLLGKRLADGGWGSSLQTALAICSLCRLGYPVEKLREAGKLLVSQRQGKGWPIRTFLLDPYVKKRLHHAGSLALTTAICLEALVLLEKKPVELTRSDAAAEHMATLIGTQARTRLERLPAGLGTASLAILEKTERGDSDYQIRLVAWRFAQCLRKNQKAISNDLLVQLGLANLYGWIAYTIYDDFLDHEGRPEHLPIANLALRELVLILSQVLPENRAFQELVGRTLDSIEAANHWEVSHCRLPVAGEDTINLTEILLPDYKDLSNLADRSFGHALGPLAILLQLGLTIDSSEFKALAGFFRHYLIARQLNDDAHDWKDDLRRGMLTAVSSHLLADWKKGHADQNPTTYELEVLFWNQTVISISRQMLKEVRAARKSLGELESLLDTRLLAGVLEPIERAAKETMRQQKESRGFLDGFIQT